jgi:hypothetical protein
MSFMPCLSRWVLRNKLDCYFSQDLTTNVDSLRDEAVFSPKPLMAQLALGNLWTNDGKRGRNVRL